MARPWNFALGDENGKEIDVMCMSSCLMTKETEYTDRLQKERCIRSVLDGNREHRGPNRECISAEWAVKFHSGYQLTERIFETYPRCARNLELNCQRPTNGSRDALQSHPERG